VSRRARNEDSASSSTAAEYNQQPKSFNYQYQQRQPFNRFNLNNNNNKKSNARQFEQQLHIQTNPVHLSNKNASLTAAAAAIATSASSNSATLSPTSLKTQQSVSHQLQNPASNSFMRVGTSPSSFTKVKQKSANLEKIPNTSNLVGSVGSIVNKASMDAFNKVQHERQVASSSENGTANGANENKQISNAAYSLAATYANRSASINSSTLQSTGQQKPEAKPSQVGSAQRQRNKPSHTSPPHSFDYTLYKHHQQQQQQQQQQAQMVQMPAAMYPTAHAFYIAAATQYDSAANMANQQAKQYVHNASKQAISNNAATISNAFETVVSSGQQRTESNNNDSAHSYYAYNQMNTNKAVEEMDEMMKNKLSLANTVKNAEYDHSQMQAHQQQPQQQQIPTVYYYCPPSVTGQDLTLVQSQQQQHQPQQTLNGNACYYYYTPISPAPTNASMAHQTPQPQLTQLQTQQFVQTQPTQPKQAAQSSQPINYLAHYGYAEPYAVNTNVPVIQPQAHSYYAANLPLAQYPQANYYLNTQQFMALSQTQGAAAAANGLPQTNYHQSYAYVNPQSQLQQSSNQMKSAVNSHVQQQRPPSAPLHYYQSRSNTPKPVVYADQYMIDPSTFGMASSSNTTRGGKIKYSHSNRVAANQHRAINYQQQGHYSKANRTHETANRPTFGVPQNVISNQQAQQQGLTEQVQPN